MILLLFGALERLRQLRLAMGSGCSANVACVEDFYGVDFISRCLFKIKADMSNQQKKPARLSH